MKPTAFIAIAPIGVFAFGENGNMLFYKLFPRDSKAALEEFESARKSLPKDFVLQLQDYDIKIMEEGYRFLRKAFRYYSNSFFLEDEKANAFLSEFCILLSRRNMKTSIGRDKLVVHASNALGDITKNLSLFLERLHEWYSLHYPELRVGEKELLSNILLYGNRKNFPGYIESVGIELEKSDEDVIVEYAKVIKEMSDRKKKLEIYVKETVKEIAPNISSVVEPLLASRLISLAGSMEKLAKMPASTIQLLGAEKALFRHLHKKGKSPKYGLLFQDRRIQNAPTDKRGKIARIVSSKIMQAARIDFYSGRNETGRLEEEMGNEIKNALER